MVTAFQDRIEIVSPGSLLSAVSRESLLAGTSFPFWRNQSLNYFLNRMQLAQGEGQGVPTIIESMRRNGSPEPTFQFGPATVTMILRANPRAIAAI